MLAHVGLRPLWPVVLFLPWLLFGFACVLQSIRKARDSALHTAH